MGGQERGVVPPRLQHRHSVGPHRIEELLAHLLGGMAVLGLQRNGELVAGLHHRTRNCAQGRGGAAYGGGSGAGGTVRQIGPGRLLSVTNSRERVGRFGKSGRGGYCRLQTPGNGGVRLGDRLGPVQNGGGGGGGGSPITMHHSLTVPAWSSPLLHTGPHSQEEGRRRVAAKAPVLRGWQDGTSWYYAPTGDLSGCGGGGGGAWQSLRGSKGQGCNGRGRGGGA